MTVTRSKIKQLEKELIIRESDLWHTCYQSYKTGRYFVIREGELKEYDTLEELQQDNGLTGKGQLIIVTTYGGDALPKKQLH